MASDTFNRRMIRADELQDPTAGDLARALTRTQAPTVADPAVLGLAAFALPTFMLGFVNAEIVNKNAAPVVFGLMLFYAGIGQLLAGMWEFRRNNSFGTVAFGSFGLFYLSLWAFFHFYEKEVPPAQLGDSLGLFFVCWAVLAAILWVASFHTTLVINLIFLLTTALLTALGIGNFIDNTTVLHVGGYIGIALGLVGWYGCASTLVNETFGRTVIPNPCLGRACELAVESEPYGDDSRQEQSARTSHRMTAEAGSSGPSR
jgi:succinate-acetate transporter protein